MMSQRIQLFKESRILKGYTIAVRDDWSLRVKRILINDYQKELYEKEFEDKLITENEFYVWLEKILENKYQQKKAYFEQNKIA